jgi:hypothetical protein
MHLEKLNFFFLFFYLPFSVLFASAESLLPYMKFLSPVSQIHLCRTFWVVSLSPYSSHG